MAVKRATAVVGISALLLLGFAAYELTLAGGSRTSNPPSPTEPPVLAAIVLTDEHAPAGWVFERTHRGRDVLTYMIRYGEVANAYPGFIEARATEFCVAGQGCGVSWVALYESEAAAEASFELFHGEMLVGWGLGEAGRSLGLGEDEGRGYSNNLGNAAANHAYLWRRGSLIMSVIGLTEPGVEGALEREELRHLAEGMSARSR